MAAYLVRFKSNETQHRESIIIITRNILSSEDGKTEFTDRLSKAVKDIERLKSLYIERITRIEQSIKYKASKCVLCCSDYTVINKADQVMQS